MSKTSEPIVRDEVIGFCGESCGGDLHPVIADGAWSAEKCTKCNGSWWFQVPRKIDEIAAAEAAEKSRREKSERGDVKNLEARAQHAWVVFGDSLHATGNEVTAWIAVVRAVDASRAVLTEEEAARITSSLNLSVGPDFERYVAVQTKVTAALMRVSRGDYRTGNVGAPKAVASQRDELISILGIALVGLRTAVEKYSADDQVLVNVQAGLRELGLNPDRMHDDALRPESAEGL